METKLSLQNNPNSYTLIVEESLEFKIRKLLKDIHNIEWSGILFYTIEGSLDTTITVKCKDLLPLNIGSGAFTSFEVDAKIVSYVAEHELYDCMQGLIHSHHNMATFFSGTDTNTLLKEGSDSNNFVSLIVNNEGTYNAAITWKEHSVKKVTKTFFGASIASDTEKEETEVCYSYMTVQVENKEIVDDELDGIIKALKKEKELAAAKYTSPITVKTSYQKGCEGDGKLDLFNYRDVEYNPFPDAYTPSSHRPNCYDKEYYNKGVSDRHDKTGTALTNVENNKSVQINIFENKQYEKALEAATAQLITLNILAKAIPTKDRDKIFNTINNRVKDTFPVADDFELVLESVIEIVMQILAPSDSSFDDEITMVASDLIGELEPFESSVDHVSDIIRILNAYI